MRNAKSSGLWRRFGSLTLILAVFAVAWQSPRPTTVDAAGITFVQSAGSTNDASASTITQAFPAANTFGDLIVATVSYDSAGGTSQTCSDSQVNTYANAVLMNDTRHNQAIGICYAMNVKAGANTVTANFGGAKTYRRITVQEYSGVAATAALDKFASNTGTGPTATSTAITTTTPGELILGTAMDDGQAVATFSGTNGFSVRQNVGALASEDQVQATNGSISASFTMSAGNDYEIAVAAFKSGVPPPPDTTPPTVSISVPVANAFVFGTATAVSATAADNVSVAGVQFQLDGANLGAEDTTSPYSVTWNTTTATDGAHSLTAIARDAAGNKTTSAAVSVTVDNTAPTGSVIINGGATATNSTASTLTLSASDLNGVTQMRFSNTGSSFSTAETFATTKAWTLATGAGVKTVYVQYKDTTGNWSPSFTSTITLDTTAPTISAVASSGISNNSATITWTTNEPATSQVEYGITTSYGTLTSIDPTLVTSHSVTLTGLASVTTYDYRVHSKDAAGNEKIGSNTTFKTLTGPDTTPPSVPTNLAATAVSQTQINLSWTASTDNVKVTGYNVFRNSVQIATPSGTTFQDTGLTTGTSYNYTVSAFDAAGNTSAQSAITVGTTQAPDTTAPSTPTNLVATPVSQTQINLSWTASTDNVGVTGYNVFRNSVRIATPTTASYQDTGLTTGTTYTYTVSAFDAAANVSALTAPVTATTFAPDTTPPIVNISSPTDGSTVSGSITITANASDNVGVAGVTFQMDGANIAAEDTTTPYSATLNTASLTAGSTHVLTAIARDSAGNTATSAPVHITIFVDNVAPSTPTNLTATAFSSGQINLSWTASTDNVGVTGYNIFRNAVQVGTSTTTSYSDTGLAASTTYTYTVQAFDAAANVSAQSTSANATTPAAPAGVNWPLRINAGGRYLEDQSGTPFLMVGDAGWQLTTQISQANVLTYLDNRKSLGFNAVEIMAISSLMQNGAPNNFYGQAPFTGGASNWSTPNEAYWTNVDFVLNAMKQRNMVAILFPSYLGYACGNQGWCAQMQSQSDAVMTAYGKFIGNRYKSYGNIIWMTGGDVNDVNYGVDGKDQDIENGIRSTFPGALFSAEAERGELAGVDAYANVLDINAVYAGDAAPMAQTAYAHSRPFMLQEGYYENENGNGLDTIESESADTYLGGGLAGNIFGSCPLWHFAATSAAAKNWCTTYTAPFNTWQNNLNSPGSIANGALGKLMLSRKWWSFVPDYANTVVTSGKSSSGSYESTSRTSNGETIMAWDPTGGQLTVNMTNITGPQAKVWWFSVDDGTTSLVGTYPTTGSMNFTPNGARKILVIDSASSNLAAPGTTVYNPVPDTSAPTVPGNLTATTVSTSQINLSWTASTDDTGVTGYDVFRNGVQIGTPAGTTFQDTGLTAGTSYNYTVAAFDFAGNTSAQSAVVVGMTQAPDTTAPSIPTNLTATPVSQNQINLSWTASTDNVGVTGYNVLQNGIIIGTTAQTSYQNTGLAASTTYAYTVSAFDAAGNTSGVSQAANATTLTPDTITPSAPTNLVSSNITSSTATISWTASTDNVGVTGYDVYRNSLLLATTSATSITDSGLAGSTTYSYTVAAFDAANNLSAQSAALGVTTTSAALAPTFVQVSQNLITSGTADTTAFTTANTAGNLIVVYAIWNNTGTATITDTRGNVYASASGPTTWNSSWHSQVFYAKNIAAGANSVTATFQTAINSFGIIYIHEYANANTTAPIETSIAANGTGTTISTGSLTTVNNKDLIFVGVGSNGTVGGASSGYTSRSTVYGNITEDTTATTAGTYSTTISHNGSAWVVNTLAIKGH